MFYCRSSFQRSRISFKARSYSQRSLQSCTWYRRLYSQFSLNTTAVLTTSFSYVNCYSNKAYFTASTPLVGDTKKTCLSVERHTYLNLVSRWLPLHIECRNSNQSANAHSIQWKVWFLSAVGSLARQSEKRSLHTSIELESLA